MKTNKFDFLIFYYLFSFVLTIIILLSNYNRNINERIRKEIQVNNIEITESGYLVQLNINGELEYYFYECE